MSTISTVGLHSRSTWRWLAAVACVILALPAQAADTAPTPPFRQVWEWHGGTQVLGPVLVGSSVYLTSDDFVALDWATGRVRWRRRFATRSGGPGFLAAADGILVAPVDKVGLFRLDPVTGKTLWGPIPTADYIGQPLVTDGKVYWHCAKWVICAEDANAGRRLWRTDLCSDKDRPCSFVHLRALSIDGQQLVVPGANNRIELLDTGTGRRMESRRPREGAVDSWQEVTGPRSNNRQLVWRPDDEIQAVDVESRKVIWRARSRAGMDMSEPLLVGGQVIVLMGPRLVAFALADGVRLWESDPGVLAEDVQSPRVLEWDGDLLLADPWGIHRITTGAPAPPPSAPKVRRARASALVRRLASLSDSEKRTLVSLGEEAADALIDALERNAEDPSERITEILGKVVSRRHYAKLRALRDGSVKTCLSTRGQRLLDAAFFKVADDSLVPELLADIKSFGRTPDARFPLTDAALDFLGRSSHPDAIAFLRAVLTDERQDPRLRQLAFVRLPVTGGDAGIQAVLAARRPRKNAAALTEVQEILAAAFEARFRFQPTRDVPAFVQFPRDVPPFEIVGYEGKVVPLVAETQARQTSGGAALVSFAWPRETFEGEKLGSLESESPDASIIWNADRTRARVQVCVRYGPKDGRGNDIELTRIDGRWFATSLRPAWIS